MNCKKKKKHEVVKTCETSEYTEVNILRRVTPADRAARHPLLRRPPISQQLSKARVPAP